jgi:hypothetical protein
MDIRHGFSLESPAATIPWGISEVELKTLLGSALRRVTKGYSTVSCTSLGGLCHELGFHFEPRTGGRLVELEFFRRAHPDQEASYREFQEHFENQFGPPATVLSGSEGLPTCEWHFGPVSIRHFVFDRFGPEKHMRVRFNAG